MIIEHNITQIYKSDNTTIEYFNFLKDYLNLTDNTIFICMKDHRDAEPTPIYSTSGSTTRRRRTV